MPGSQLTLEEFKRSRFADLERRTAEVLARGRLYSGVVVSLSTERLVLYNQYTTLSAALGTVTVEAADPINPPLVLSLLSAGVFVTNVADYVRGVYADESALKAPIRAATTQAEIEAVIDTR